MWAWMSSHREHKFNYEAGIVGEDAANAAIPDSERICKHSKCHIKEEFWRWELNIVKTLLEQRENNKDKREGWSSLPKKAKQPLGLLKKDLRLLKGHCQLRWGISPVRQAHWRVVVTAEVTKLMTSVERVIWPPPTNSLPGKLST